MKSNPFYLLDDDESDVKVTKVDALNKNEAVASVRYDESDDQGWSTTTKKKVSSGRGGKSRGGQQQRGQRGGKSKVRKGKVEEFIVVNVKSVTAALHDYIAQDRNMNGYETNWINLWRKDFLWNLFFPSIQKNDFFIIGRDNKYKVVDFLCFKAGVSNDLTEDLNRFKSTFGIGDINVYNALLHMPKYDFVNDPDVHKALQQAWKAHVPEEFKVGESIMFTASVAPFIVEDDQVFVYAGISALNGLIENISGKFDFNVDTNFDDCIIRKFKDDTGIDLAQELLVEGNAYFWDFNYYNVIWRYYFVQYESRDAIPQDQVNAFTAGNRKEKEKTDFRWIELNDFLDQSSSHTQKCFNFATVSENEEDEKTNLEKLEAFLATKKTTGSVETTEESLPEETTAETTTEE